MGVRVNDVPVPSKPYTPHFGPIHVNSASVFRALCENHPGVNITQDDYNNGYTLFSFKLQQDGEEGSLSAVDKGVCDIELKFSKATENNMTLIVMAKFPDIFHIENRRQEEYEQH